MLQFHIETAVTFGRQRYADDIPGIRDGKAGKVGIAKYGPSIGFADDFRQLADTIKHEKQFCEQRTRGAIAALSVFRQVTCGLMTCRRQTRR
ncbi:hypothetical protein B9031_014855 [Klebsiella aerogenes]|nr:hypothetical protein B9031_014855 [Klebsiella aerogenes]